MRDMWVSRRPRLAVLLVLGLAVADGAGIYFAHNKLNRPWDTSPGIYAEAPVAAAGTGPVVTAEGPPKPPVLAFNDIAAPKSAPVYEPLRPVPEFRPVEIDMSQYDLSQYDRADRSTAKPAARETLIPAVRIAVLRPARHKMDAFASAFASDISRAAPGRLELPEVSFAAPPATSGPLPFADSPEGPARDEATPSQAEIPVVQIEDQVAAPADARTEESNVADAQAAPQSAPETNAGSEGELPAL